MKTFLEKLKKINYKVIIAAVLTGLIVFVLAYADTNEAAYSKFHKFVSNRLLYRGMESLDFKINDIFQPDNNVDENMDVLVIGIDAYSMAESRMGDWKDWSRGVYADLLDKLHSNGHRPAAVCFDILFSKKGDEEGDTRFVEACKKYGDTIQGIHYTFDQKVIGVGETVHVPVIADVTKPFDALYAVSKVACTNNLLSSDQLARTIFVDMYSEEVSGDGYVPHEPVDSLAVAAYKQYLEYNGMEYVPHKYIAEKKSPIYFTYSRGVPRNGKTFDYKSFYDALYNYDDLAEYCDGYIVFVGGYAAGMSDDFFTPASSEKMYGVDIHANTLEAIAQGKLQIPANRTVTAIVYSIISMLLVLFVYLVSLPLAITGTVAVILLDFLSNIICRKTGIYLQVVYLVIPAFIILVTSIVRHYLIARAEKAKINNAFKMYVAPEVVDEMAGSGTYELKLGGQTKDIAVLFIDIRGFTTMSEGLHPEEVVSILNEYFGLVTDAIFKNKGTLDKFIGDAAMAVFNSPNDLDDYVYRAVHTAWDIALGSQELAQKLLDTHGRTINYGIGVNCGPATIGNIGSEFRMDFTAIGDTVNTSARLEANAKAGQILISQAVYDRVKDWIETEEIGTIPLKGKSNEIFVYNVINVKDKPGYIESRSESGKKSKRNRLNHGQI